MEPTNNGPENPELTQIKEDIIRVDQLYKAALKEKAFKNLYLFNKYVLDVEKGDDKFVRLGEFHKQLCNFVQDRFDKRKLILIPRGHLKTKLISIGYPTMKICNNPKIRILIYSATWQMAVDIHKTIQKNLQGMEKIIDIVGDLSEGAPEWAQDRTRLKQNDKREPTITAAGIDNNLVGGHYDLIIMDDVVNRDNVSTMDQIQKVITKYKDSLDLLEPGGELIVIGTRWHDSDLYGYLLDPSNDALDNYLTLILKAFDGNIMTGDGFEALWKEKFTREAFMKLLKEEGWGHFSSQYMNDPVPLEDAKFKRTWFRYYQSDDIRGKLLNKFLLIDPAISLTREADYTAMVVIGIDEWNNVFILDITRAKMKPKEFIDELFRLKEKWQVIDVGVEQVQFQKAIAYNLREDVRFKLKPFHITELKPDDRSKDQRILGLQPQYENGMIFHNKSLPNNIYLEDELVRFPKTAHDDVIDALSYALDIMYPAKQKSERGSKRHKYLYSS